MVYLFCVKPFFFGKMYFLKIILSGSALFIKQEFVIVTDLIQGRVQDFLKGGGGVQYLLVP